MSGYVSLEIPQASTCNLDCVYCYIPKDKTLSKIHKSWSKRIKDGSYLEMVSENYVQADLENVNLWGGEPSIGFKDLDKLREMFIQFPKLKNIGTSTNFSDIRPHEMLITSLQQIAKETGRKITLDLQISIDGDEEQTNKNRGKDVFKKIFENIKKLVDVTKKAPDINIEIHTKATNIDEDYKRFVEEPEYLERFLDSFTFLQVSYAEGLDWPKNVFIGLFTVPTLALPGSYTKEDGEKFFQYHLLLEKLAASKYKHYFGDMYYSRFVAIMDTAKQLNDYDVNQTMVCSAGVFMVGLDGDGLTHGCHGSFWYNYKDYLENADHLSDWTEGRRIFDFSADKFWELSKPVVSEFRDTYNKSRLSYTLSGYANNVAQKANTAYSTIKVLAKANQINEIYKTDDNMAKLFAYFIALKSTCWVNSQYQHGSLFPNNLSLYRMYGNGTFQYMIEKYRRNHGIQ
jgi:sulfatase maturation enzyme AslB (radical SAM superfamily)